MDEKQFRDTLGELNSAPCPFEKFLFSSLGHCRFLRRHLIGEREAAGCARPAARADCVELLTILQQKAQFTLRLTRSQIALPHQKALQLQTGGLLGLQRVLVPTEQCERVADVHGLIEEAKRVFGDLHSLPYAEVLRSVASQRGRRRRSAAPPNH